MRATEIAAHLAERAEDCCRHLLPNGQRVGRDWCAGSIAGESGSSLKVCLTGTKAGVWADFSSDQKGDLIGLWQAVRSCQLSDACQAAQDWLGLPAEVRNAERPRPQPKRIETKPPSESWLKLQAAMRPMTYAELQQLAVLRKIPNTAGMQLASDAGQLFFGEVHDDGFDWPCWIITDSSRRSAQARRLDGLPFTKIKSKSKTIKDCDSRWPIGAADLNHPEFVMVEGGPDFLAAWHLIWEQGRTAFSRPVTMLGASNSIHPDALKIMADRKCRLFPHADDNFAGAKAGLRWKASLESMGTTVIPFDFRRVGVKDLNEFIVKAAAEVIA